MFTFIVGFVCWCGVYSHVVVLGLSVRLSWYHMWWVRWLQLLVWHMSTLRECGSERVTAMWYGDRGGVVVVSMGHGYIYVVHMIHVLCLVHMTCKR